MTSSSGIIDVPHIIKPPPIMKRSIPLILLVVGLLVIGLGYSRKDKGQATIDLGKTEIDIGKSDSAFSGYFILGGVLAVAGVVLLATGRKG